MVTTGRAEAGRLMLIIFTISLKASKMDQLFVLLFTDILADCPFECLKPGAWWSRETWCPCRCIERNQTMSLSETGEFFAARRFKISSCPTAFRIFPPHGLTCPLRCLFSDKCYGRFSFERSSANFPPNATVTVGFQKPLLVWSKWRGSWR